MNYLQPERLDALARAYALGTLTPRARRRFARTVAGSPRAAQAVADWQRVLRVLEDGAPAAPQPRPQVWSSLQARLFAPDARTPREGVRRGPARTWASWFGGLGLACGALLGAGVLLVQPQWANLESSTGPAPASYVGVLSDPQGRALIATTARRQGNVLRLRLLHPVALRPDQVLAVWAWNDADPTPRLVGRSPNVQSADLVLAAPAETLLGTMTHLGVSATEAGAAVPAPPAGPFLAQGPCAKVW
jgi:anti-sigma-K factor RskA